MTSQYRPRPQIPTYGFFTEENIFYISINCQEILKADLKTVSSYISNSIEYMIT